MSTVISAVGYLRRSTDRQETSIPDQKVAVQEYADANRYRIIRWYVDDGISGDATDRRHDFQRMIADAGEKKDFKAILVWDQDRFGRFDSLEAGRWIDPLRRAKVRLVTINEGMIDWDDMTGRLMYSIKQEAKHQFLKDLSRNVTRGQLEAARAGSWIGGIPYAYRLEGPHKNKRLVLGDPSEIRVVKRIFKEFVEEGRSMTNIAERLSAAGVLSPGGRNRFRYDAVQVILQNPVYTGDYVACRAANGKYHVIRKGTVAPSNGKRHRNPEEDWIVHRDHHEPIIDRETFAKAQAIFAEHKTGHCPYAPEENPFLFSGLLRCGKCGAILWGMRGGSHKQADRPRYYECGNAKRAQRGEEAKCAGTTVREDRVLQVIADHLDKEFLRLDGKRVAWKAERKELKPGDLPKAFAKVKKLVAPPKQLALERQLAEKQTKQLSAQLVRARGNLGLLDPSNIPAVQEQIRGWEQLLAELEIELRKKPPTEQDINAEAMEVLRALYWLGVLFREAANPQDPETTEGPVLTGAKECLALRRFLRHIESITVHTKKEGRGSGTRHVLECGEIRLKIIGSVTGNLNPHATG
jgi:DNA invertase Pin-like site-specific DNA recombinase